MEFFIAEKSITELDDVHWENLVEKSKLSVAIMFYNPLCPHCTAMMPHFDQYAGDFKRKMVIARIDVAKNPYPMGDTALWPRRHSSSSAEGGLFMR